MLCSFPYQQTILSQHLDKKFLIDSQVNQDYLLAIESEIDKLLAQKKEEELDDELLNTKKI